MPWLEHHIACLSWQDSKVKASGLCRGDARREGEIRGAADQAEQAGLHIRGQACVDGVRSSCVLGRRREGKGAIVCNCAADGDLEEGGVSLEDGWLTVSTESAVLGSGAGGGIGDGYVDGVVQAVGGQGGVVGCAERDETTAGCGDEGGEEAGGEYY